MNPGRRTLCRRRDALALPLTVVLLAALGGSAAHGVGFTDEFRLRDCSWSSKGSTNPYFNLRPGYQLVLEGEDDGEDARVEITVLRQTRRITFEIDGMPVTVRARVVEEREFADGELAEVSRNFFARCRHTSDIFYFGEDVDNYEDGQIVNHDGAWIAGEDGAMPGLIMPAPSCSAPSTSRRSPPRPRPSTAAATSRWASRSPPRPAPSPTASAWSTRRRWTRRRWTPRSTARASAR